MYDLIIIGAGPAGLSAAVYAARKKLSLIVMAETAGGQMIKAHAVNNYLGLPGISGLELLQKFQNHAEESGIKIKEGAQAEKILKLDSGGFEIKTSQGNFQSRAVILASGKKYRQLEIPGGREFEGRGITYCATCDAPLFTKKIVAVIGGGDAGQDAASQLTKYAKKIYLLNKYGKLRGANIGAQEKILQDKKIEVINNCRPIEVKGEKFVKSLIYQQNGSAEKKEIPVDGIFVEIGSVPSSNFLKDMVKLNAKDEIIIDPKNNMTSCPGIFAAGDVTDTPHKQMIIAAGEGAKAALGAYEYLKSK